MVDEEKAVPSVESDRTATQLIGMRPDVNSNGATKAPTDSTTDKTPKGPNVVEFDEDDPENPMNWPAARKTTAIVILTTLTLLS
jgi:hypothetical protein